MRNLLVRGLVVLGCVTGGRGNTNVVHGRQRRAQDMITIVRNRGNPTAPVGCP